MHYTSALLAGVIDCISPLAGILCLLLLSLFVACLFGQSYKIILTYKPSLVYIPRFKNGTTTKWEDALPTYNDVIERYPGCTVGAIINGAGIVVLDIDSREGWDRLMGHGFIKSKDVLKFPKVNAGDGRHTGGGHMISQTDTPYGAKHFPEHQFDILANNGHGVVFMKQDKYPADFRFENIDRDNLLNFDTCRNTISQILTGDPNTISNATKKQCNAVDEETDEDDTDGFFDKHARYIEHFIENCPKKSVHNTTNTGWPLWEAEQHGYKVNHLFKNGFKEDKHRDSPNCGLLYNVFVADSTLDTQPVYVEAPLPFPVNGYVSSEDVRSALADHNKALFVARGGYGKTTAVVNYTVEEGDTGFVIAAPYRVVSENYKRKYASLMDKDERLRKRVVYTALDKEGERKYYSYDGISWIEDEYIFPHRSSIILCTTQGSVLNYQDELFPYVPVL